MRVPEAKVVILGAQGVGKTSFINRYVGQIFEQHTSPTIGASFYSCTIDVRGHEVKISIWDTAGQERFRSMAPMYYRNANAAILMFDITCYASFESMKSWIFELKARLDEPIVLCVVGSKCDMNNFRQVSFKEAAEYAESIRASYHEASALNSEGVEAVFLDIGMELVKQTQRRVMEGKIVGDMAFIDGEIVHLSEYKPLPMRELDDERSFLCC